MKITTMVPIQHQSLGNDTKTIILLIPHRVDLLLKLIGIRKVYFVQVKKSLFYIICRQNKSLMMLDDV